MKIKTHALTLQLSNTPIHIIQQPLKQYILNKHKHTKYLQFIQPTKKIILGIVYNKSFNSQQKNIQEALILKKYIFIISETPNTNKTKYKHYIK